MNMSCNLFIMPLDIIIFSVIVLVSNYVSQLNKYCFGMR